MHDAARGEAPAATRPLPYWPGQWVHRGGGVSSGVKVQPFGLEDWPLARRRLAAGFGDDARWDRLIRRLREAPPGPAGEPLGLLLEVPDGAGGVLLTLSSLRPPEHGAAGAAAQRVTNLSSWAVEPSARGHAVWLLTAAVRDRSVRYTDLTPDATVVPLLQRLGFAARLPICVRVWTPRAAGGRRGARVIAGAAALAMLRDHPLAAAFEAHVRLGCRVLALTDADGSAPLAVVLKGRRRRGLVPMAEVVFADSLAALARGLPVLCGWLLLRGVLLLEYEAHDGHVAAVPVQRLPRPRLARGPVPADDRIDQLHSELVYLDVG